MASLITGRTPMIAIQLAFGRGRRSPSLGRGIVIVGPKTAAGTGAVDTVTQLYDENEARDFFGAGSAPHLACKAAWEVNEKALVYGVIADTGAATAATKNIAIAGPATAAGVAHVRVGDTILDIPVSVGDAAADFAADIIAAANASVTLPSVFTWAGPATLTSTTKDVGTVSALTRIRIYDVPAGLTVDGAASMIGVHDTGGGAGEPDWSDALAAVYTTFPTDAEFIVPTTNTTIALTTAVTGLKARMLANSQPAVKKWLHAVVGQAPAAVATATTQADSFDDGGTDPTTDVGPYFNIFCAKGNWGLPGETAARLTAAREGDTRTDRNKRWCGITGGRALPGLTLPISDAEYMTPEDIEVCLVNGVTPAYYDKASTTAGCRWPVTCKHVTGGALDYRASDTNIPDVTVYVGKLVGVRFGDQDWERLAEDDAEGRAPEDLPQRTVTPSIAAATYNALYEGELYGLGYVDKTYKDDAGVLKTATDLTLFEVDAVTAGILNGYVPCFVTRWLRGIGIVISEYGRG